MVGFRIPDWARTRLDLAAWPKGATCCVRSAAREEPEKDSPLATAMDRIAGSSVLANLSRRSRGDG